MPKWFNSNYLAIHLPLGKMLNADNSRNYSSVMLEVEVGGVLAIMGDPFLIISHHNCNAVQSSV